MKKIIALILACLMLTMSFVACTKGEGETTTEPAENNNDTTTAPEADQTTEEVTEAPVELAYKSAVDVLNIAWNAFADDQKFFVGGGNTYNPDTLSMEGPAKFVATADTDYNDNLGYPAADAAKIDDAASMFHGMNVNTFTVGAFHFTSSADVDAMVNTIKDNILARQWMCGFPEKLVIVKLPGDYLVSMWGLGEGAVNTFVEKLTSNIEGAEIVVEQNIG